MKTYVSITDSSGNKKYEFSPNFRRNLLLGAVFLVSIFLLLLLSNLSLKLKNSDLEDILQKIYAQNLELRNSNEELLKARNDLTKELDKSGEELSNLELMAALQETNLKEQKQNGSLNLSSNLSLKFKKVIPSGWPVQNRGVTDSYGERIHPVSRVKRLHHGIDLRASVGTPAYATADGFVKFSGDSGTGYGKLVSIAHNFGFETRYAHMENVDVVRMGQWVKKGDLIGYTGNTGLSTGPHLHYEVRFLDHSLDPINFMEQTGLFYKERKVPWNATAKAIEDF
ncbi:M23 family metallopeptidase [Campylobacter corcagiensis]|uniref:M23 family metallopeptidase n=1 Tax=Campylobacter corcagiensis TaxID=1448857 RepID=A0A7M1LEU9_9BACT|nr:M23 family metallopeptidase [Campylobacter corcagiensis]QKF64992.1 zinc metallopeptidase, M23 family [Campylobacter corcagiensis]QOQ86853.1 M23 family metallopeptidase [Campylobacter corcagiensis]